MKTVRMTGLFVLLGSLPLLFANDAPRSGYGTGTVVSVQKQEVESPSYGGGDNPSDAPLRSEFYAYNVQISFDCGLYDGYYESPYDYLPMPIAADKQLPVRLTRHAIFLKLANEREMQMRMVHHTQNGGGCSSQPNRR